MSLKLHSGFCTKLHSCRTTNSWTTEYYTASNSFSFTGSRNIVLQYIKFQNQIISMAANSYNSDVKKVFEIFGKCMFKEFDQIVACVHDRLNKKVSSKTSTAVKFLADLFPLCESPFATVRDAVKRGVGEMKDARKLRAASKLANLAYKWSEEEGVQMRETLCQAALVLYVSFYWNITRVTTKQGTDRKAIETLAKVAVSNFIRWYLNQPDEKPFSVEIITEGVTANMKSTGLFQSEQTMVYDKVTKTEYDPIKLFTKTALVVDDGSNAQTYYGKQSMKQPLKYGYRFLFEHEMENKSVVLKEYIQILNPDINLVKPELDKGAWRELLNAIREEDPNLMESRLKQAIEHNYRTAKIDIDYCPAPVSTFLGRYEELGTLKTLLTQHQVVALVGMGGLGKTQLSRKYVQVNKADYQYKYWLESETPEKLKNAFKKFAKKLHVESDSIDDEVVNDVYKKIQAVPTILVFDNVEKPADVYAYLPTRVDLPPGVTIHVLVTSRWTDWTCDEQIQCYKLQPFDVSVSLQIFQRKFGETCVDTMQDEWTELARMLGYLPLALQVATSYIHKRYKHNSDLPTVLADYMKQLREGADGLLNDPLTEYDNRSVYASMLLTLKQLENKTDDKGKFAVTVINVAAYMYPDRIYKDDLSKLLDNDENTCMLDEALVILTEYSLFNQVVVWGGYVHYTIHRIIQTSIRHNQTVAGTADTYYTGALKYAIAQDYDSPRDVFSYANERASAVVDCYKDNPSSILLRYLVECKAIPAVHAVFNEMTRHQVQSLIQEQDLLYWAVESEDLRMVQLLCSHGANINQLSLEEGDPPLHHAMGNIAIATWLLENGAAPSQRDDAGCNALHAAIMWANHKMVPAIIKTDRAVVNETDDDGKTPLLSVDYYDNEEDILSTIRVLAESGADNTAVDKRGNTVLHLAAQGARAAAVSLILQLNKDLVNIVNEDGETALHVLHHGMRAVDEQFLLTIRVLVESGADLTKVDRRGNTVLHSATMGACVGAISLILQLNKGLIDTKNKDGQTALHVLGNGFNFKRRREEKRKKLFPRIKETARVLIMNGLSLDTRDNKERTPLDTVQPEFKDILLQVAEECNNQLREEVRN